MRGPQVAVKSAASTEGHDQATHASAKSAAPCRPQREVKQRRREPLPREYRQALVIIAREHRKTFRRLFLSDPTLKDRGARLYRSLLLPRSRKPGRPGLAEVSLALHMREQGKPWKEIYLVCIEDYANLDAAVRRWRQRELRDRVRSRRYQRRKRTKPSAPGQISE